MYLSCFTLKFGKPILSSLSLDFLFFRCFNETKCVLWLAAGQGAIRSVWIKHMTHVQFSKPSIINNSKFGHPLGFQLAAYLIDETNGMFHEPGVFLT